MSKKLWTILVLVAVLAASNTLAGPLYSNYNYYDGFATEDTATWTKIQWAGTIAHDATNEWMASVYVSPTTVRGTFMTKPNALVENTVEVGEKAALKLQGLSVSSGWSTGSFLVYYLDTATSDYYGDAQLILDRGQLSGRTTGWGWSFYSADTGYVLLSGDGASGGVDRYVEFQRIDADTLKAAVYSDATLTTEIAGYTWENAGSLAEELHVGLRLNNTKGFQWDDMTIAVPEPATLAILGLGTIGLLRRRK